MHQHLVIAPNHPDLSHLPDEAASVAEAIGGKLLSGDVRVRTVLDYVESRRRNGIVIPVLGVWMCTHATLDGAWLWNREVLSAFAIAGLLNTLEAHWVALNTCASAEVIDIIQQGAPYVDAIATIRDVPDKAAWLHGRLIAQNYREHGDLRAALFAAAPAGASLYRFFPAPTAKNGRMISNREESQIEVRLAKLEELVAQLDESVERLGNSVIGLRTSVYGDVDDAQIGLVRFVRWIAVGVAINSLMSTVTLIVLLARLFGGV